MGITDPLASYLDSITIQSVVKMSDEEAKCKLLELATINHNRLTVKLSKLQYLIYVDIITDGCNLVISKKDALCVSGFLRLVTMDPEYSEFREILGDVMVTAAKALLFEIEEGLAKESHELANDLEEVLNQTASDSITDNEEAEPDISVENL